MIIINIIASLLYKLFAKNATNSTQIYIKMYERLGIFLCLSIFILPPILVYLSSRMLSLTRAVPGTCEKLVVNVTTGG